MENKFLLPILPMQSKVLFKLQNSKTDENVFTQKFKVRRSWFLNDTNGLLLELR